MRIIEFLIIVAFGVIIGGFLSSEFVIPYFETLGKDHPIVTGSLIFLVFALIGVMSRLFKIIDKLS
jgi:hypothetical protein